jgi:hypothetical protein
VNESIRLRVPADLADELIEAGDAVRSFTTRSAGSDVAQMIIEATNNSADFVTVAIAFGAVSRVVRKTAETVRRSGNAGVEVVRKNRSLRVDVPRDMPIEEVESQLRPLIESLFSSSGEAELKRP